MKYLLTVMIISALSLPSILFAQKAKIRGVITYFFNEHQGNKPDLGAEVFAVDTAKCPKYNSDIAFQYDLATLKTDKGDDFKAIDTKNALNNKEIIDSPDANKATVDGAGNYSLDLPAGTYYVLIRSKGRNAVTMTELMGKVYVIKVRLKPDQVKDLSYNFPLK